MFKLADANQQSRELGGGRDREHLDG